MNRESSRQARLDRKRAQSRDEIVTATRSILLRDGMAGFTLDAVARELQLTKAALYYYFPSRDALLLEAIRVELEAEAEAVAKVVGEADDAGGALAALAETVFDHYADRIDAFRLAYLYGQVSGGAEPASAEALEAVRPLNELLYGGVERKLREAGGALADDLDPRRLAFIAHMAAVGLLTMKGLVETYGDPLVHSDDELKRDLVRLLRTCVDDAGT